MTLLCVFIASQTEYLFYGPQRITACLNKLWVGAVFAGSHFNVSYEGSLL